MKNQGFRLSDIIHCNESCCNATTMRVLRGQTDLYLGTGQLRKTVQATLIYPKMPNITSPSPDTYGYPIHSRCWTLAEAAFGPGVYENLGNLIEAFRQKWHQIPPAPLFDKSWLDQGASTNCMRVPGLPLGSDPVFVPEINDFLQLIRCRAFDPSWSYSDVPRCRPPTSMCHWRLNT